jgi:hypothetical protein
MNTIETISLAMGAAWGSGINLYAAILTLGVMGITGSVTLPAELQVLSNPLVIGAAGLMYAVEFFADKIPGVDTIWDGLHTFIRIPAGAMLAAGAVGELGAGAELAALIAGGSLAATTHATKAGTRAVVNASPEPFSNWTLSIGEDMAVFGGVWAALQHPWLFSTALIVFILLMVWILPKIWRGIRKVFGWLFRMLGSKDQPDAPQTETSEATGDGENKPEA